MIYIQVCDTLVHFDPHKTKLVVMDEARDGSTTLIIQSLSRNMDDVHIKFKDREEARKGYEAIASVVKHAAVSVIDIEGESDLCVEFVSKNDDYMVENVLRKYLGNQLFDELRRTGKIKMSNGTDSDKTYPTGEPILGSR